MKKSMFFLVTFLSVVLILNSCKKEEESFDEALLIGKWVANSGESSGTEHYKYLANGSGSTWDTADGVYEDDPQWFNWTLVKSDLTHIHLINGNPDLPKDYTVTELTSTSLKYHDDFGTSHSFTKESK